MMDWILSTIFTSMWGWIGTAGIVALACLAVAWFFPPLRQIAVSIAGIAIAAATIYSKGARDRAALEARRKEEAVRKAQESYDKIEKRQDSVDSVRDRLKRGDF